MSLGQELAAFGNSAIKSYTTLEDNKRANQEADIRKQQADRQRRQWEADDAYGTTLQEIYKKHGLGDPTVPTMDGSTGMSTAELSGSTPAPAPAPAPAAAIPITPAASPGGGAIPAAPVGVGLPGPTPVEGADVVATGPRTAPVAVPKSPPASMFYELGMAAAKHAQLTGDRQSMDDASKYMQTYFHQMKAPVAAHIVEGAATDESLTKTLDKMNIAMSVAAAPGEAGKQGLKVYTFAGPDGQVHNIPSTDSVSAGKIIADSVLGEDDAVVAGLLKVTPDLQRKNLQDQQYKLSLAQTTHAEGEEKRAIELAPARRAEAIARVDLTRSGADENRAQMSKVIATTQPEVEKLQAERDAAAARARASGTKADAQARPGWKLQMTKDEDGAPVRQLFNPQTKQVQVETGELGGGWIDSAEAARLPRIMADPSVKTGRVVPVLNKNTGMINYKVPGLPGAAPTLDAALKASVQRPGAIPAQPRR